MKRSEVTDLILAARADRGLKWAEIAQAVGGSKEFVTAACLGQMKLQKAQAEALVRLLELPAEASRALQAVPFRGSLPTGVTADPLIYRFYELVSVYGTTFKELIQDEFGDGIMSAIDFRMEVQREPDPAGDRVGIKMSGKFLPYKEF